MRSAGKKFHGTLHPVWTTPYPQAEYPLALVSTSLIQRLENARDHTKQISHKVPQFFEEPERVIPKAAEKTSPVDAEAALVRRVLIHGVRPSIIGHIDR